MQTTLIPIDELHIELVALDHLLHTQREPLPLADPPRSPGVYVAFAVDVPPYRNPHIAEGRYPVYAGSAKDLGERIGRHRGNAAAVPDLDGGARLHMTWLETSSHAGAVFVEHLLIDLLDPLWCTTFLGGFGSRSQGRSRETQCPPPWAVLHPGRHVGSGQGQVSAALLIQRAETHLSATTRPLWERLRPT
jgi:hypothetical protein